MKEEVKKRGRWKENLGKFLIDIAKYIVTGVIIASLFKDVENEIFVYGIGFVLAASSLLVGLVLTNNIVEDK
jgi:hypothetical protein